MSAHRYRILVEGDLGSPCASASTAVTISARNSATEITRPIIDASHPQGLLERIDGTGTTFEGTVN